MDQEIGERGGLGSLYDWQLKEREGAKTVELMDGPPYANGTVHTGHAINKILKDFIVKSCISRGERVVFRPGWDCHGLPIELKITKNTQGKSPIEIREMAREVAMNAMAAQMSSFKRWGVSADWSDPYVTMSADYVSTQLRAFGRLVEKGLVYRDHKPVYWSPSSGTALAESELEYKEDHSSTAAFYRFKVIDLPLSSVSLSSALSKSHLIYALTWTTTPWTLPLNNAISIDSTQEYSLVQFDDQIKNPIVELYLVATPLVDSLRSQFAARPFTVRGTVRGSDLEGKFYVGCWSKDVALPILPSPHVTMTMGTGCVHTAYAHGFDDFEVARRRGDRVEVNVDERGRYTRAMGHDLEGKSVLGEGTKKVLELLKKDVVMTTKHVHSYPYDWRTKKPVIIRSSAQWFIDTLPLSGKAEKAIEGISIGAGSTDLSKSLVSMVTKRPSWCISRQRVWGVPIPAVTVVGEEGSARTSRELVERVADLVEREGDTDVWWKKSIDEIVDEKVRVSLGGGPLEKSMDVMDVWLDSGLAWICARKKSDRGEKRVADFVSEGVDQFRGWFQSMLLTSVALQDCAPYKRVFVHGFCMDDKGRKMSKSIGNVVDPDTVTDGSMSQNALGADGLRLWVALYGAETSGESRIGPQVIKEVEKKIVLIRNSIKFVLGAQSGMDVNWRPTGELPLLDQFILRRSIEFGSRMDSLNSSFRFRSMANESVLFVQSLSSNYLSLIRDRLYCDALSSDSHRSAQFTVRMVGSLLTHALSPILPHLAVEYEMHAVEGNPEGKLRERREYGQSREDNERKMLNGMRLRSDLDEVSTLLINLRSKIGETVGPKEDIGVKHVTLHLSHSDWTVLESVDERDVMEMLGVSTVEKKREGESTTISIGVSPRIRCDRCRKTRRERGKDHCDRCSEALKGREGL